MAEAERKIIETFLTGKNLRKVMAHLCNSYHGNNTSDPITDTVVMMLTCPINLIITEVGVALFQGKPTALYPFSKMDVDQIYYVEEVVRSCLLRCNSVGLHTDHHAMVQMGGGCILYTKTMNSRQQHNHQGPMLLLDPLEVLRCTCDCIFASKDYSDTEIRKVICSIVLQRVCCMATIKQKDKQEASCYLSSLATPTITEHISSE